MSVKFIIFMSLATATLPVCAAEPPTSPTRNGTIKKPAFLESSEDDPPESSWKSQGTHVLHNREADTAKEKSSENWLEADVSAEKFPEKLGAQAFVVKDEEIPGGCGTAAPRVNNHRYFMCGGAIVNNRFAVTTGSCMEHVLLSKHNVKAKLAVLIAGTTDISQVIRVIDHTFHPSYNRDVDSPSHAVNNIVLLHLECEICSKGAVIPSLADQGIGQSCNREECNVVYLLELPRGPNIVFVEHAEYLPLCRRKKSLSEALESLTTRTRIGYRILDRFVISRNMHRSFRKAPKLATMPVFFSGLAPDNESQTNHISRKLANTKRKNLLKVQGSRRMEEVQDPDEPSGRKSISETKNDGPEVLDRGKNQKIEEVVGRIVDSIMGKIEEIVSKNKMGITRGNDRPMSADIKSKLEKAVKEIAESIVNSVLENTGNSTGRKDDTAMDKVIDQIVDEMVRGISDNLDTMVHGSRTSLNDTVDSVVDTVKAAVDSSISTNTNSTGSKQCPPVGSSLMQGKTVVGLISYTCAGAESKAPWIYTSIADNKQWIEETVQNPMANSPQSQPPQQVSNNNGNPINMPNNNGVQNTPVGNSPQNQWQQQIGNGPQTQWQQQISNANSDQLNSPAGNSVQNAPNNYNPTANIPQSQPPQQVLNNNGNSINRPNNNGIQNTPVGNSPQYQWQQQIGNGPQTQWQQQISNTNSDQLNSPTGNSIQNAPNNYNPTANIPQSQPPQQVSNNNFDPINMPNNDGLQNTPVGNSPQNQWQQQIGNGPQAEEQPVSNTDCTPIVIPDNNCWQNVPINCEPISNSPQQQPVPSTDDVPVAKSPQDQWQQQIKNGPQTQEQPVSNNDCAPIVTPDNNCEQNIPINYDPCNSPQQQPVGNRPGTQGQLPGTNGIPTQNGPENQLPQPAPNSNDGQSLQQPEVLRTNANSEPTNLLNCRQDTPTNIVPPSQIAQNGANNTQSNEGTQPSALIGDRSKNRVDLFRPDGGKNKYQNVLPPTKNPKSDSMLSNVIHSQSQWTSSNKGADTRININNCVTQRDGTVNCNSTSYNSLDDFNRNRNGRARNKIFQLHGYNSEGNRVGTI